MIKTVIMGTGRMGSLIRTTAEGVIDAAGEPVFDIVAQIGFDLSELESAPAADVIIDFSNIVTFDAVVAYVERTGAALVSGTTGYTPDQMDRLRELGQNARVMHSGNYSIGIAALRHLVAQATRELPGFDCEIVETHHNLMGLDRIQNHDCVSVFQKSGVECQPIVGGGFHGEYDLALYKGQSPYLFQ